MDASFKFATEAMSVEMEGPEEFVGPHIEFLLPYVRRMTGAATPADEGPLPVGLGGVGVWWSRFVPPSVNPSLQETILLFAYYMRTYRKTVFVSEDLRRCFQVMGLEEPKSLLQILGTMKRDHQTLLNAGKRGEYMMNVPGLKRVKELLGELADAANGDTRRSAGATRDPDAHSIFRD